MPEKFRKIMENPSEWRQRMSEKIAGDLDMDHFGVAGVYLIGSVKKFTAGPGSDIDLLIHFRGSEEQKKELKAWLKGWGECLAFFNHTLNGSATENLLDLHFITDDDIKLQTSYAVMINSVNDRAKPLKLK